CLPPSIRHISLTSSSVGAHNEKTSLNSASRSRSFTGAPVARDCGSTLSWVQALRNWQNCNVRDSASRASAYVVCVAATRTARLRNVEGFSYLTLSAASSRTYAGALRSDRSSWRLTSESRTLLR